MVEKAGAKWKPFTFLKVLAEGDESGETIAIGQPELVEAAVKRQILRRVTAGEIPRVVREKNKGERREERE